MIEVILHHLFTRTGVYIFFVGAVILTFESLIQRAWVKSLFFCALGLLWLYYFYRVFNFFGNLGVDSFAETESFDLSIAFFWLSTLLSLFNFGLSPRSVALYCVVAVCVFVCARLVLHAFPLSNDRRSAVNSLFGGVLIVFAVLQNVGGSIILYSENSDAYKRIKSNFVSPAADITADPKLGVFMFVGESTSVMNMGLYGYPRNTTPILGQLEQEPGFIKFMNVFSTHTHTSPSLLEALSIDRESNDVSVPINDRIRVSFVDVLGSADISTALYSNKGQAGSWNYASSIVFANAKRTFASESHLLGNYDSVVDRPFDHDFLEENLSSERLDSSPESMIVFHAYAVHGPYLDNIPEEFRKKVDDYFGNRDPSAITGSLHTLRKVEEYDSSIRYTDYSVAKALGMVANADTPWVFIYFPDHGDAVFPYRGHDSSRFIHEMARVPLIMFFNSAAREAEPALFEKYTELAKTGSVSTLAQLTPTLFDLFNVTISRETLPVIGSPSMPEPILVRKTSAGITGINLYPDTDSSTLIDGSDSATRHFTISRKFQSGGPLICYHRSNTIAKALRGSLVTNCLEIDVVVEDDSVQVYHPPLKNRTGLDLEYLFSAVKADSELSFWFDAKNLLTGKMCSRFLASLRSRDFSESQVLIEFPSGSYSAVGEIHQCAGNMKSHGNFHTSYYVPTRVAVSCSESLAGGESFASALPCRKLEEDISAAKNSGIFTDISFDYSGIKAIEALPLAREFNWNTWHVEASEIQSIEPSRFRMVIPINDDPNNM